MNYRTNIPGFVGYTISRTGEVFCDGRILKPLQSLGRASRVKLNSSDGNFIRITIAKLLAVTFISNPENHTKIIFKDRNNNNCTVENIQWVSYVEWSRFVNHRTESDALLGPPKPRKEPDWIDPERVPLKNFPGYYITKNGVVYKGSRITKPVVKKNKSLKVRIWQGNKYLFLGLAELVAEHFIPNPRHHAKIIFKDRDNHNCRADNIAWVDGETFIYYAGIHIGSKKKVLTKEEALKQCKNIYLRNYYQSLDESWLHDCWQELEKKITIENWLHYRSECFMYFIDRAKRYSLLGDPLGLILQYMKGVRAKFYKEISPNMPVSVVLKTDESLRYFARKERD